MGQSVKNNEINALDLLSGQEQRPLNLGVSLEMVIFSPLCIMRCPEEMASLSYPSS